MVSEEAPLIRTSLSLTDANTAHSRDITYAAIDCVTG